MSKKVFLVMTLKDGQTGVYIKNAFENLGWETILYDYTERSKQLSDEEIIKEIEETLKTIDKPDLLLSLKGLFVSPKALQIAKEKGIPTATWIFDVTFFGTPLIEHSGFVSIVRLYDTFYSFCKNVDEFKEIGVNAKQLMEGYDEEHNGYCQPPKNLEKVGADVVFLGSISDLFRERIKYLEKVAKEGFDFKIYGYVDKRIEQYEFKKNLQFGYAVNNYHSYVCQSSKIVLGLDGWPEVEDSFSARLYRTLACGGFYLMRHTKGVEKYFTPGIHLDTFENEEEMIRKIHYYLEHPKEREMIAKAGQVKVREHQFINRIEKEFGRGDNGTS